MLCVEMVHIYSLSGVYLSSPLTNLFLQHHSGCDEAGTPPSGVTECCSLEEKIKQNHVVGLGLGSDQFEM